MRNFPTLHFDLSLQNKMSRAEKWPRQYERVPTLEEVDRDDFVAYTKARQQWARDRAVDLEEVKILRQRVQDCVRREDVNYPQRCREQTIAYMEAFRKYKSQGWNKKHLGGQFRTINNAKAAEAEAAGSSAAD